MGAQQAPPGDTRHRSAAGSRRPWLKRALVATLAAALLVALYVLVLVVCRVVSYDGHPPGLAALSARSSPDAGDEVKWRPPQSGWLLFDKGADSRPARHVGDGRPPEVGFKWQTGAILDDFALGIALGDDEQDERAGNYGSSRHSAIDAGAAAADQMTPPTLHHQLGQSSNAADKVQQQQRQTRVIDNMSYSRTQKDLRDARERLEKLRPSGESSAGANKSEPPTETPTNISLLSAKSSASPAPDAPSKTNETSMGQQRHSLGVGESKKRHSSVKKRRKRRAGAIASERK